MQTIARDEILREVHHAYEAQDYRQALSKLEDLERLQGQSAQMSHDIGVVLYRMNDLPSAIRRLREAAELDGGSEVLQNVITILGSLLEAKSEPGQSETEASREWFSDSLSAVFEEAQQVSDEDWFAALKQSVAGHPFRGHLLPGFVDPETQARFVGSSGEFTLAEAWNFMRVVLRYAGGANVPLDGSATMLDFGCGWGRHTRFLLKYAHPDNIYGVDVNSGMIERCRRLFGGCNFMRVSPFPPSVFRDGLFDLLLGYSVFSHLSPACADAWIEEFGRIVRPGGMVIMTTQGRSLLDLCRRLRATGAQQTTHEKLLAAAFTDEAAAYRAYDGGEFLFTSHLGPDASYGEALIPRGYIEQRWLGQFDLVDFVDDRSFLPQALFVLARK